MIEQEELEVMANPNLITPVGELDPCVEDVKAPEEVVKDVVTEAEQ